MAHAPHTNDDVAAQARAGLIPTPCPKVLGGFREADHGHWFEYAERRWPCDDIEPALPHIVYVGNGETRLAKVLKTVAFVLVDEGQIERWHIKAHRIYEMRAS